MSRRVTPRTALVLFIALVVIALVQAVWWIVFMARLTDEKVELARQLGGSEDFVEMVHQEEITRQIMVGSEGVFFLLLILFGAWLIYRALVKTQELKFHHDNFMMSVTHELKTPLASLKVYLDTLQSSKIPPEKKERILPRMRQDVDRLERMVDNILQAGRFERRQVSFSMNRLDLTELVQDRIDRLQRLPSDIPRQIESDLQPDVIVEGDIAELRRAVDIVLENGLKYHTGKNIKLDIELAADEKAATLKVRDGGVGLSRSDLAAVFDRFYRVDNKAARSVPGSGLGLYLCREIVKRHGGKVSAESEGPGRGSTFTIELKRAES